MTDRPILFSAPMIRALLDGRKSQTRRILKPQPDVFEVDGKPATVEAIHVEGQPLPRIAIGRVITRQQLRFAKGDRLYVREHWRTESNVYDDLAPSEMDADYPVIYAADADWSTNKTVGRFRQGMHMPRLASRLTLTVTDVRVRRLQQISAADSIAEGVECDTCVAMGKSACMRLGCFASLAAFRGIWGKINGAASWEANPWVVALTFTFDKRNIDT